MLFVEKTNSTSRAHRYRVSSSDRVIYTVLTKASQIIGQWFVPLSIHKHVKHVSPEHFVVTVHEPSTLAESHLMWNNRAWNALPSMLSAHDSELLGKLAVPILRQLTETVGHIEAMSLWDPNVWLSRPHPMVQPENMCVMPEEIARTLREESSLPLVPSKY